MIIDILWGPFLEFGFMRRALVGCIAISVSATPVGMFMILRRMSLTGDAMAHAILPGTAIAYLFTGLSLGAMTLGGLVAGLVVAMAAGLVARRTQLREDTSLAAFYLISLALGVMLLSVRGNNIDLFHVLFGNILALNNPSLFLLASIASVSILLLAIILRSLILECVDPAFLRSVSRTSPIAHYGFLVLMVINLVAGFHALGTLMAVGIMILPGAAAKFWARSLQGMLGLGVLLSISGSYLGLLLSYYYDLPAGPAIILFLGTVYVMSVFFGSESGLLSRRIYRRHLAG
ncbi:MAG TPA: zinc ABC transporter permease [Gammaproteobacteria bacterium]|nr:zinc ABC transporter permease [Gammaproteobacteria bacterium]